MNDMNDSSQANVSVQESFGRSPLLMSRNDTALLVVDLQEKLVPHVQHHDRLVWNVGRLVTGAKILGVDIRVTEQYPKGLGHTVEPIANQLESVSEKVTFSCRGCDGLFENMAGQQIAKVLLTGIETHVCVQQTALDLIASGFDVFLAVDAVSSRFVIDHQTALRRMEAQGALLTTVEAALFEWCETSKADEFKAISKLVQETLE